MHLLVGLGNPGERYRGTRHNLGWEAMALLARVFGFSSGVFRFKGQFGDGRIGAKKVLWLCPDTYMNLSGESVGAAVQFFKLEPEQVIVFHDDLDLIPGRVRIKIGGGNGGHNGLKSIQQLIGSADFIRVRLGIGRPPGHMDTAKFVLAPFNQDERDLILPRLEGLPNALPALLEGDLPGAMNRLLNGS
ncbi:MAG: aminoacyl-tRNA hydrolase [Magnetococcales bacterium]|nr:aminoacyl-tRNA hydrolase [Magnetococcales bacterium]